MSYTVEITTEDGFLPLPDRLCSELGFNVGDVLICELAADRSELIMKKHMDQSLNDTQIASAGNLTRVISYEPDSFNDG